jgi:hypothetical protein
MQLYFSIIKTGYFIITIRFNYLKFYHYLFRTTIFFTFPSFWLSQFSNSSNSNYGKFMV